MITASGHTKPVGVHFSLSKRKGDGGLQFLVLAQKDTLPYLPQSHDHYYCRDASSNTIEEVSDGPNRIRCRGTSRGTDDREGIQYARLEDSLSASCVGVHFSTPRRNVLSRAAFHHLHWFDRCFAAPICNLLRISERPIGPPSSMLCFPLLRYAAAC